MFSLSSKTGGGGGKICIWRFDNFKKIKEIYDNGSGTEAIVFDESTLYSGHENKRIEAIKFG